MSRYETAVQEALGWNGRYFAYLNECRHFGRLVAHRYEQYLEAPKGRLRYMGLSDKLEGTDDVRELTDYPTLVRGPNTFYYFGLSLRYTHNDSRYVDERFYLGLQRSGAGWVVIWAEKSFLVPDDKPDALNVLFDALQQDTLQNFAAPITSPTRTIGFLQHEVAE
ncbi:hypothetical protein [Massilia sp. PWRC2]|uniref:hypothetical protein n=1 Tax=Massilia sp. PWRC2 TaxID=2804626 RepID=UPI003CF55E8E